MKIITYNINGIRSAIKKGILKWIIKINPDIICFQEIKICEKNIDKNIFKNLNYHQYWLSSKKKGYSGVGILTKVIPENIIYKTGINSIDQESGRFIQLIFKYYSIINIYIPSGSIKNRIIFKLKFMDDFLSYINNIKLIYNNLIISGDYNICHENIDIHNINNNKLSGFLPEERKWMTKFINLGFIDSFRYIIKDPFHYTWWSYRNNSKLKNKGWRIDYNIVSNSMKNKILNSYISRDLDYSDHSPVFLEINI